MTDRIVVGASLSLLAIAAFVLFSAALRRVLIEAEGDDVIATAAFGGALLAMAAGLSAETINMVGALRARDGQLSDALAQWLAIITAVVGASLLTPVSYVGEITGGSLMLLALVIAIVLSPNPRRGRPPRQGDWRGVNE